MKDPGSAELDWSVVDGVIFDVDGTLFDHLAIRRPLVTRMIAHLATGRMTWQDVQTLRHFRRERDLLALAGAEGIGLLQFERAALAAGRPPDEVEAVVSRWMYREPLDRIASLAFPDAARFVEKVRERGMRTGVFSDYPAQAKLERLGISVDVVRDATCVDVGRLKPCPHGLIRVAELLGVTPSRCLVIGDRDDRDGEAARRGGFPFLLKVRARNGAQRGEFRSYEELIRAVDAGHVKSG